MDVRVIWISLSAALTLSALPFLPARAEDANSYRSSKTYDELTPAEITAAKRAARTKKIKTLVVCADPGNMPLSNSKREGFQNKIVEAVGKRMGSEISYFWRPYLERGLTRETFANNECDVLLDMPADYQGLLTTTPIYRSTYVFATPEDRGLVIKDLDDPRLKELRIGVFQHSGIRIVLQQHGVANMQVHVISHDADLSPEKQPWRQVQEVLDGKLDIAAVWGPFAGFLRTMRNAPLALQPVNLMDDKIPLEFNLAMGVRPTDVVLKFMLDNALEASKDEIKTILTEYGVPLVQCSECIVGGDLPSHGSFYKRMQSQARKEYLEPLSADRTQLNAQATSQRVDAKRVETWLAEGADLKQELGNAVLASDAARVTLLLEKGADINARSLQGLAPLHAAARQRDSTMIAFLLERGADPNVRDNDGWTPLMHAVFRNHVPSIEVLTEAGADLEAAAPGGFTPLAIGISEGKFFAAKALIDAGAAIDSPAGGEALTPLMIAASQHQVERRAASLDQGPSSVEIARMLIAKGAKVDARSANGVTPLMIAASHDNPPLIGVLIQSGADPSLTTPAGQNALAIAKANQNKAAVQQLEILSVKTRAAKDAALPGSSMRR